VNVTKHSIISPEKYTGPRTSFAVISIMLNLSNWYRYFHKIKTLVLDKCLTLHYRKTAFARDIIIWTFQIHTYIHYMYAYVYAYFISNVVISLFILHLSHDI